MSLLTDEVRAWIGKEVVYTAPEPLGRAAIRYFAQAIGDDSPIYVDDDAGRAAGYDGVVAPPTLICETNQYVGGARGPDGLLGHWWDIPVDGARPVRGGNEYTFHQPVRPDDIVTATWRITDISERDGSEGVPLLFVRSEATYTNQRGDLLAINVETIIYRGSA